MKEAILTLLARSSSKVHKINLIGREFQRGNLERHLDVTFAPEQRAQAARSFDELVRDGYVQPTWNDLIEPENWVTVTESGKELLKRRLKDAVDLGLRRELASFGVEKGYVGCGGKIVPRCGAARRALRPGVA
jgi:hypothetical protein